APDTHMDALRVLSPERDWTAGPICPLATNHDDTAIVGHFGMHDVALGVGQDFARLEAEGRFQPLERGAAILVSEGGDEGGAARGQGDRKRTRLNSSHT